MAVHNHGKIYVGIGLDYETGGLDCRECACTQIALQAVRLDTWETMERYTAYIAPYGRKDTGEKGRKVLRSRWDEKQSEESLMKYEPVALSYSGITMELLYNQGLNMKEVATAILAFAQRNTVSKGNGCKPVLIGQNVVFDVGFLQQMMAFCGLQKEFEKTFAGAKDFYGNFQPHYIDLIDLGHLTFAGDPDVTSYKLELIAEKLGVELNDAHDAGADVEATLAATEVYVKRLRHASGAEASTERKVRTRNYFKI